MKRTALRKVSNKQRAELARRAQLKRELIEEYGERCQTCGGRSDFRGISLSHVIPLSRGGKTTRENCLLECGFCHDRFEKRPELRKVDISSKK